jgi:hypothetical protein
MEIGEFELIDVGDDFIDFDLIDLNVRSDDSNG